MNTPFARGMSRATELTRTGRLDEATALIRSLLQKQHAGCQEPSDDDAIEGTFTRLGNAGPGPTSHAARTHRHRPRKSLGETLRDIAAGGMQTRGMQAPVPLDMPAGAQFPLQSHQGPQGSRDYRLYIPANQPEGPMPLVVMLHGCTQSPEDFAAGTGMNALAEEFGFIGGAFLLALYLAILLVCALAAMRSKNRFASLLILGLAVNFFLYFGVNMAMVMGLAPVVGVPLPLVSYGGSAMMVIMIGFGLVQSAIVHRPRERS